MPIETGPARPEAAAQAAAALVRLMATLRAECPCDRKQTFATLSGYLLEECYEAVDALAREDLDDLEAELGDLLFEIVFLRPQPQLGFEPVAPGERGCHAHRRRRNRRRGVRYG